MAPRIWILTNKEAILERLVPEIKVVYSSGLVWSSKDELHFNYTLDPLVAKQKSKLIVRSKAQRLR